MEKTGKATMGNLKISEEVIASVAALAAKEVKGVASLARGPLTLREMLLSSQKEPPIGVSYNNDSVVLDVYVNLGPGAQVQQTATAIQAGVKESVQNMTGLPVKRVNVHISGIAFDGAAKN